MHSGFEYYTEWRTVIIVIGIPINSAFFSTKVQAIICGHR